MLVLAKDDIELMPRPVRNNNPLDIRADDSKLWLGQVGKDEGNFCIFSNPYWGIRAAVLIMFEYISLRGLKTVPEIVTRWVGGDEKQALPYLVYLRPRIGTLFTRPIKDTSDISLVLAHMANFEAGIVYADIIYYEIITNNILTYQED